MPHAEVTLPGSTSSVPTARRFVESLLSGWGHPDLGWSAALCVSELAANCALHARTQFTVRVELAGDQVRVEVADGSLRVPTQRTYGTDATTGRGLRLVEEYASSWGVDMHGAGKTVWLVLRTTTADGGASDDDGAEVDLDALLAGFGGDGDDVPGATLRSELHWPVAA
jgi:anti-sigma regulatory factor (Ser/Thr protein kinase)